VTLTLGIIIIIIIVVVVIINSRRHDERVPPFFDKGGDIDQFEYLESKTPANVQSLSL